VKNDSGGAADPGRRTRHDDHFVFDIHGIPYVALGIYALLRRNNSTTVTPAPKAQIRRFGFDHSLSGVPRRTVNLLLRQDGYV
jgi:hypothetical protein